mgnify:CR=1 FL=1
MAISERYGNLFKQDWQSAVVTVNLVGAMGAGIARAARDLNPEMFYWYNRLCRQGKFRLGDIYYFTQEDGRTFILLPTKVDWRNDATIEYIEKSLAALVETYKYHHVDSIHIPKLGCRNGGLNWEDVRPVMYKYLEKIPLDITIMV